MKMKLAGKIIAAAMAVAVAVTMTPMMGLTAYADESQASAPAAMITGADVLAEDSNTANAPTVYMANKAWRVIGYGGNGIASSSNTMTLISSGNLKTGVQFRSDMNAEDANHYSKSSLIGEVNAVADDFDSRESAGIVARTLKSGEFHYNEKADCVAGEQVNSAILWPLSTKEAGEMNKSLRMIDHLVQHENYNYWWLRSPGNQTGFASAVQADGDIAFNGNGFGVPVTNSYGVRPAFNYNLKRVVFTSAASGGKVSETVGAEALAKVGTNETSDWKLTVEEAAHQNFEVTSDVTPPCDANELSIDYSGASTGDNEYISAIIKDKDGKVTYYGRLAQATTPSGEVNVNIGGKLNDSDTLYIFNEQVNDDNKTDYSSELYEIKITRTHQLIKTEQKDPTYTETGTEAYWTCEKCGKMFSNEAATNEITEPVIIDKLPKKENPLKIKGKTAKVKSKKLKKKTQKLAVTKVIKFTKKGQGKMTYKIVSAKKGKKSFKKYIKINAKTGKVTVKKNKKMKKGTYKVKVKAKAAGNDTYRASSWRTVTFKIKVK